MSPDTTNKSVVRRSVARVLRILGVTFPSDIPVLKDDINVRISEYKADEFRNMPGMSKAKEQTSLTTSTVLSQLLSVAQNNSQWARESECLRLLNPEIEASSDIMVGSILSPTDLQTDLISVTVENTDLGIELDTKLSARLTDFFNDQIELGPKLADWTAEALYGSGAVGVLILPANNIDNLNKAADADADKLGRDPYKERGDTRKKGNKADSGEMFFSGEALITNTADTTIRTEQLTTRIDRDIITTLSGQIGYEKLNAPDILEANKDVKERIMKLFQNSINYVVFSKDPTVLARGGDHLKEKSESISTMIEKQFLFGKEQPTYLVDTTPPTEGQREPTIIIIPTHAIVPVTIPGAPDKHLGYFILVDQWGTPLANNYHDISPSAGSRKLTESSIQATYGMPSSYKLGNRMSSGQQCDSTTSVFSVTLKHLLLNKLNEYGLSGVDIDSHSALSTCMFRALLDKKKCGLVFVPEPLMVYYCFKNRPDGTGKSLTENIRTILALRTTLLISYIMGATENSINNKVIEFAVDEKTTNLEQQLDMVRNAYIEKKMMRFDNNPVTVQHDLIQKSLTIVPKGIKGLGDSIGITTEHKTTGAIMPDDGLLEKLTTWGITGLQVPHAALNHTSENEYSRGIATVNLHFNNNVKNKQKTVKKHGTKLIRQYLKYSTVLRKEITRMLQSTMGAANDSNSTEAITQDGDITDKTNVKESKITAQTNKDPISVNVDKIIANVRLTLPSPKIVVDKAQYKEIEEYIATLDKIVGSIFDDDMFMGEATEYKETIGTLRAVVKSRLLRDYIVNIGFQSSYDIPFADDVDLNEAKNLFQCMANTRKGFDDFKKHIVDKALSVSQAETDGQDTGAGSDNTGDGTTSDTNVPLDKTDENDNNDEELKKFDFDKFVPPPTF